MIASRHGWFGTLLLLLVAGQFLPLTAETAHAEQPLIHAPVMLSADAVPVVPPPLFAPAPELASDVFAQPAAIPPIATPAPLIAPPPPTVDRRLATPLQKPLARGWSYEVLPVESLYKEYIGDPKAARFASQIVHNTGEGFLWELRAGGRAPLLRFGTPSGTVGPSGRPEGWQLGVEGVATPRLNFEEELDLDFVDYRVGVPLQYQAGRWQYKFELYHLSSHAGDELLIREPEFVRLNYLRDAARFGVGYFATPDVRLYGESEWAWNNGGGSEPWHLQFGIDYSPVAPTLDPHQPQPFAAVNVGLREELDFGGAVNLLGGLQWRGAASDNVFRFGAQYYNGRSFQYEQFREHEEFLGLGIWYDF